VGLVYVVYVRRNRHSEDKQCAITIMHYPPGPDILQLRKKDILVKVVLRPARGITRNLRAEENDKFNNKFAFSLN
jgi:hypothetical protein